MFECHRDEHARNHALIFVENNGQPLLTGAGCQHNNIGFDLPENHRSFGENFTASVSCGSISYLCHYIDGTMQISKEPRGAQRRLLAANRNADYLRPDYQSRIYRVDHYGNASVIESLSRVCGSVDVIHTAAAFDDLSMIAFMKDDKKHTNIHLFDIADDRIRRSELGTEVAKIFRAFAHSPNTWVSSVWKTTYVNVYDDRVHDWVISTYKPEPHFPIHVIRTSSCVDNIVLFYEVDWVVRHPVVISALDLRNGDRYDLANACNAVTGFVHSQL